MPMTKCRSVWEQSYSGTRRNGRLKGDARHAIPACTCRNNRLSRSAWVALSQSLVNFDGVANCMSVDESRVDPSGYCLERRPDGAILVRVPSRTKGGRALPDAVFAFRAGDPQFAFWQQQFFEVHHASS